MSVICVEDFIFRSLTENKIALYVFNYENFKLIFTTLKDNKVEFHTKAPREEKTNSWLLKGISGDYDERDILNELLTLNLKNVKIKNVKKINLKEFFKAKWGRDAFLVGISSDSNSGELININRLANQITRWEKINHKNPIQCFNCQRIGHTANYCNRSYRCVKCDEGHGPGKCSVELNSETSRNEIYCINCKQKGHPASYRGCPKLIENKNIHDEKLNNILTLKNKKLKYFEKMVNPNLQYATVVRNFESNEKKKNEIKELTLSTEKHSNQTFEDSNLNKIKNSSNKIKKTNQTDNRMNPTKNVDRTGEENMNENMNENDKENKNSIYMSISEVAGGTNSPKTNDRLETILSSFMSEMKDYLTTQLNDVKNNINVNSQKIDLLFSIYEKMDNCANNNKHLNRIKCYKPNNLNIVSINVNSIVANSRRYNLIHFIRKNKVDIAMINETKLKNKHKMYFDEYNVIRDDRLDGNGGGTAVIIKKRLILNILNLTIK